MARTHPHIRLVEPQRPDLYDSLASPHESERADLTDASATGLFIAACAVNAIMWLARPRVLVLLALGTAAYFGGQLLRVWL